MDNLWQANPQFNIVALRLSIDHFCTNEAKINDFIATDFILSNKYFADDHLPDSKELMHIKINYIVLLALENMGNICPLQNEIDSMETLLFEFASSIKNLMNTSCYRSSQRTAA